MSLIFRPPLSKNNAKSDFPDIITTDKRFRFTEVGLMCEVSKSYVFKTFTDDFDMRLCVCKVGAEAH